MGVTELRNTLHVSTVLFYSGMQGLPRCWAIIPQKQLPYNGIQQVKLAEEEWQA